MNALRWLHIQIEWFMLQALTACDARHPGWIVMCEDSYDRPDWHALFGGEQFGMDFHTGRFPTRKDAHQFAQYRNAIALPGERYYLAHEINHPELPEEY